jgi:hypothetical protein
MQFFVAFVKTFVTFVVKLFGEDFLFFCQPNYQINDFLVF